MSSSAADRWAAHIAGQIPDAEPLDPGEDSAAPNCPHCLTPLALVGPDDALRWRCSTCGHASS